MAAKRIKNPKLTDFNGGSNRKIYPLQNPLNQGYGVNTPNRNPTKEQSNGRMINVRGEKIDFYIEEIETDFSMAGTTAQSQKLRQFFPHNMVQPAITIRGRAPNSHQYNRLAAFVRVSQYDSVSGRQLRDSGQALRNTFTKEQGTVLIPTVRLIIRNGTRKEFPYNGTGVKGIHKPWKLEGYIKSMPAGGKRFDPAPAFEFQFLVAESQVGLWKDVAVAGDGIKSWVKIFERRHAQGFVKNAGEKTPGVKGEDDPDNFEPPLGGNTPGAIGA